MQSEAHAAWLLQRARKGMLAQPRYAGGTFEGGADAATVEDVVRWGSAGGAQILGLAQTGTLQVGMQATSPFTGWTIRATSACTIWPLGRWPAVGAPR